jgi:hypothetical protein
LFVQFMSWLKWFAGVFFFLGIAGCASVSVPEAAKDVTPQQKVMARAQARWDAMVAGSLDKAYEFISPAGRLAMPLQEYRLRVNTQYWRKVKVRNATCEPDLCEVVLDFEYVLNGLQLSQVITEKWILESGEWWYVYRG